MLLSKWLPCDFEQCSIAIHPLPFATSPMGRGYLSRSQFLVNIGIPIPGKPVFLLRRGPGGCFSIYSGPCLNIKGLFPNSYKDKMILRLVVFWLFWLCYRLLQDKQDLSTQWETTLQCSVVSYWLGTDTKSSLHYLTTTNCCRTQIVSYLLWCSICVYNSTIYIIMSVFACIY